MKKSMIAIGMVLCFTIGLMVSAVGNEFINVKLVDYEIRCGGLPINDDLQAPLLSYEDRTYMSVRDVAAMIARDVQWNENDEKITFIQHKQEHRLIQKEETALAIGKAVAKEYYSEYINENTKYMVKLLESGPTGIDYYAVFIMFNPPKDREIDLIEMANECDVSVDVGPVIGGTSVSERQEDGSLKWVMGRMGRLEID